MFSSVLGDLFRYLQGTLSRYIISVNKTNSLALTPWQLQCDTLTYIIVAFSYYTVLSTWMGVGQYKMIDASGPLPCSWWFLALLYDTSIVCTSIWYEILSCDHASWSPVSPEDLASQWNIVCGTAYNCLALVLASWVEIGESAHIDFHSKKVA